jgi:ferritin-like metal-binding protein YciE
MDEPPSATSLYPNEYPVPAIVAPRRVIRKREAESPPVRGEFGRNLTRPSQFFLTVTLTAKERAMPNRKNLEDLFSETLKDIYFAEKQILRALPKMAKEATSPELKQAFETHRDQTEGHVDRLNEVFELLGRPARGKTCEAILGIIDEAKEIMDEFKGAEALDAGLASSAQAVEHYEIARYGTLKTWAKELGHNDAAQLLDETLREEIETDQLLTKLATSTIRMKAA